MYIVALPIAIVVIISIGDGSVRFNHKMNLFFWSVQSNLKIKPTSFLLACHRSLEAAFIFFLVLVAQIIFYHMFLNKMNDAV